MLLIVGTVRLPPENLERARPAMLAMAQASRAEVGCLEYGYAEDVFVPGLIHVKELWSDQAALDAHFKTAHMATWRSHWPRFGVSDRRLFAYEVASERQL